VDLVLRATFGFFLVFLVTRVAGRRELSTLEPFDPRGPRCSDVGDAHVPSAHA
jgi:hypothetical protein